MPYAKALFGGLVAAISFAIPVVDNGLIASEVLGIVLAGLTGTGLVYAVPNTTRPRNQRGAITVVEALAVVALLLAIVVLAERVL